MYSARKPLRWLALVALFCAYPVRVFSQIYTDAEFRFGIKKHTVSDIELGQTGISSVRAIPYTLGGYTFSAGYIFKPDSINIAFKAGFSYWNSRSGLIYTNSGMNAVSASNAYLQHKMFTVDLGLNFEFKMNKGVASSGIQVLLPVYMNGVEIENEQFVNEEIRRNVEYRNGPGVRISQDFTLWNKGKTTLFAGIGAGWVWAQRKNRTLLNEAAVISPSQRNLQYLTDRQINEKGRINDPALSGFDPNRPMQTQTYHDPLSFVSIKWGILWHFNHKKT